MVLWLPCVPPSQVKKEDEKCVAAAKELTSPLGKTNKKMNEVFHFRLCPSWVVVLRDLVIKKGGRRAYRGSCTGDSGKVRSPSPVTELYGGVLPQEIDEKQDKRLQENG